ncbi:MAG TPA: LPS-assembly protein LptD [Burkholderiaceae bacterium]|nr:LPS-assembly protein LptD [Burkholderiaceae bacterium]
MDRQLLERVAPGQQPGGTTFARARKIEGTIDDRIVLEGDAEIRREGSVVRGDRITYTQATDEVNVEGHARIFREGAVFAGPRLDFKIEAQTGAMPNANFSYAPRQGRGDATLIEFLGNQQARMTQARFTTCAPGDDAWWIQAERIEIDGLEESATASTAKLYFQGIPIFASPIFGFPVGDRRRSGFLTPSLGLSSTLGTDIRIPYYWNIAPNYDYTIAPRAMSKRGVLFENELRFLEPTMRGTLVYNTIPNDRELDRSRDQTSIRYEYSSPSGFAGGINYNRVSDDNFFVDFSESILGSSNKVLPQDAFLAYNQAYWNAAVRVTKNQTLQDPLAPITPPYERLPQAALNGYVADWRGFEASALLDGTRFDHATLETGDRYVADVRVAYPWTAPGWFVIPRARFVSRAYSLDPTLHPGDSSPTVTTPMLSLDTGLVFERNTTWFGRASQQTLEPRVYYAYIPYKNQSDLPNFDSAQVDLNYVQLFNENIYSGYDRIAEANNLTLALGTRILDSETGAERLRAAIGQRYYFGSQRVTLPGEPPRTGDSTDVLGGVTGLLGPSWAIDLAAQYSTEQSQFVRATAGARWQPRRASVISAYYRYRKDDIDQIDLATQWPLSDRWYAVGRVNYSIQDSRVVDALAGFEYKADCWILRFAAQRFATTTDQATTSVYVQLELSGLTSVGTNALKQLQRNIPGYQMLNPLPRQPGRFDYYE